MNTVFRDIFRAIHEGKWLSIEYLNKEGKTTKYWIGIKDLNVRNRMLNVDGLHLRFYTVEQLGIRLDSIKSSRVIEGSYCPVNEDLVRDIYENPHKYLNIFSNTANLKILNYLEMCNRMDCVPTVSEYALIKQIDGDRIGKDGSYDLSDEQFQEIVNRFQYGDDLNERAGGKLLIKSLALNCLSIHTQRGLHVLAYRRLNLDVKRRALRPDTDITICTEFTVDGKVQSIRRYLDADEYELINDFEKNQEKIKDCITRRLKPYGESVDDMPYIIGLEAEIPLDLHKEYGSIIKMYNKGEAPVPIRAFFGDLLERPRRRAARPIALIDRKINMDQLLAVNNAMKYPVAYIQGPPGTGKTNTIINTIVTAFFNERTVLFASYNNHPINGVYEKLSGMEYDGKKIPFPILRLGNSQKVREALITMRRLYEENKDIRLSEAALDKDKEDRGARAKKLSDLLKRYEELLDMQERRETIDRLIEYERKMGSSLNRMSFQEDLAHRQRKQIERRIEASGGVSEDDAVALLDDDTEKLKEYIYYSSVKFIQKIGKPQNAELKDILYTQDKDIQYDRFTKYLGCRENIVKLQKIFPVIATTCISAHRLGGAEPMFNMTIMDEASQCNTAVSLVPIVRGESLMLVGDPQQLNPVIMLDEASNDKLKKKYAISDEYDYRKNSIYKTFLACDAVSDEILLHNHYRCHKKIIEFNNRKYYNSRLKIMSDSREKNPLVYVDIPQAYTDLKNTSPSEVREIVDYAVGNRDKSIGVITPFVNQRRLIEEALEQAQVYNVTCGTVHAFQGDEKDVVLFSTAITDQTQSGSYEWLKNNKELINVATSRARDKLIILSSSSNLERLHSKDSADDLYELVNYVRSDGGAAVTAKHANSRALGVKPFSSATEDAFLQNLNHALENIWLTQSRYVVHKEVAISHVFNDNTDYNDLFYSGRFDFVVYERLGREEIPVLAIELDGKEHFDSDIVRNRDMKKNSICKEHGFELIRVENSYARRYNHIKEILISFFSVMH